MQLVVTTEISENISSIQIEENCRNVFKENNILNCASLVLFKYFFKSMYFALSVVHIAQPFPQK